jgi:predicted Zn-dependent protease
LYTLFTLFAVALAVPGCQSNPTVDEHRIEADKQWAALRGQYRYKMASDAIARRNMNDAVSALTEAIRFDADNPLYHRTLAECLLETGDLRGAEAEFDAAHRLGDAEPRWHYGLGLLRERLGRPEEAVEHHRNAWKREPSNRDYFQALIETMITAGRHEEAVTLLNDNVDAFDRNADLLALRAKAHVLSGDDESACADFAKAESVVAHSPTLTEAYAQSLIRLGRDRDALDKLTPYLATEVSLTGRAGREFATNINPNPSPIDRKPLELSSSGIRLTAACLARTGSMNRARSLLESHLREHPQDARAWYILAEVALKTGDRRLANRSIERGRSLAPNVPHWGELRQRLNGGDLNQR